ncbi:hypothetical protein SG34_020295 [Thalassomonas viridans]|uniref:Uncharacterized protein n=1 Tax=Thalassomonas viridans TaxID=137584 RepID=A0AAF0C8B4_9GAMM|nr:hypothetical protein [Thalassomonas viridans]WDE03704.1 hypothetical protein SG34_020295 [Thalassomonas viridans]
MSGEIDICINSKTCSSLPCPSNDQEAVAAFLRDNPHISGNFIPQGTPYILRQGPVDKSRPWQELRPDLVSNFNQLKALPAESRRNIADLNEAYGTDLLVALSEFHQAEIAPMVAEVKKYQQDTVIPFLKSDSHGLVGAAATALESRFMGFAKASIKYQQALENLYKAYRAKVRGIELVKLEQTVTSLNQELNAKFGTELNKYMGNAKASRRGTVWSSPERAKHIAQSARNIKPIDLSSTRAFEIIKRFEKAANIAGKRIILLDAGLRTIEVFKDFAADKDWQRSAAREVAGFGASTAAGAWVGSKVIASTLGVAMLATPAGWFFAIGIGLAAGYGAAKITDWGVKWLADLAYEGSAYFIR